MNLKKTSNLLFIFIMVMVDIFALFLSLEIAMYLQINYFQEVFPNFDLKYLNKYYWIIFVTILILAFEKIYFIRYDFWSDIRRIFKGLFLSFILCFTIIVLSKLSLDYSRSLIVSFFCISFLVLPFFKRYTKKILFLYLDLFKFKVKIVSNSSQEEKLKNEIKKNWYFGYKLSKRKFDIVIIVSKGFEVKELEKRIKIYLKKTKDIYIVPYMEHLDFSHSNVVDYFNIRLNSIHVENRLLNFENITIKYIFEKILTILVFPFALFLHCFIYIFIKLDSSGKVLFKQRRLGENGKSFNVYKYRTMYENGEEILKNYLKENPEEIEYYKIYHKYKSDPRITKFGKFLRISSLDEFPQFYNVLRGDMNLIGPRPYMVEEKNRLGKLNENIILRVRPGITGFWQVSGRNELTFEERIELDKWYIQNWSLWIDFVIFLKTIKVILGKVGAK